MKRSVSTCLVSAALLLAAGCDPMSGDGAGEGNASTPDSPAVEASATAPGDTEATPAATATATATQGAASAEATGSGARNVSEETDDFVFDYSYPAEAGNLPQLAALLDRRLERDRRRLATSSAEAREEARSNGFPYNKHSSSREWEVVADLPGWLSLSAELSSYSGGAHGMYGIDTLLWQKDQQRALEPLELFESAQALGDAVHDRFCDRLDSQREERRGEPVDAESGEDFDTCPDMDELVVLLGSSNGVAFNRMTLYAGPYVAGPYAEGDYEVNLDVTQAVIAAVKPEYRDDFAIRN